MKIAYVTVRFPQPSEAFAAVDVRWLVGEGLHVVVLALRGPNPDHARMLRERALHRVPVECATAANTFRGAGWGLAHPGVTASLLAFMLRTTWPRPLHLLRSLYLVPSTLRCLAAIRREKPDVVHLFWGHFPALVGYLVRRYHPGIVLSHFLGAYDLEYGYGPSGPVARSADAVWTHAHANRPRIEALGVPPGRIHVVHRGIEVDDEPATPKTPHRVVAAGRLIGVKSFDKAIAAFARAHRRFPDATLVVAGEGPERASLQRVARDLDVSGAVEFAGHLPQDELFAHLERAEVFLTMSCSPSERLPNVAKEAALRRCLVVTARSAAIDELFTDGVDAFVVPCHDVEAAAERLIRAFTDTALRERMGEAARARIVDSFDVRRTMARYLEHWRVLAAGRRPHSSDAAGVGRR